MSALDCIDRLSKTHIPFENLRYCLVSHDKNPYKMDGTRASVSNYEDFVAFDEVLSSTRLDDFSGLGISIQASNIVAIDIDHCVKTPLDINTLDERAKDIVDMFKDFAYIEFSFSGSGIRILTRQNEIKNYRTNYYIKNSNNGIEFYQPTYDGVVSNRYVTITGNTIYNNHIDTKEDHRDTIMAFLDKYMKLKTKHATSVSITHLNEDKSLDKLRVLVKRHLLLNQSFQDDWFKDGIHPTTADRDESERDFRILSYLYSNITTDEVKVKQLFEESIFFKTKDGSHIRKWEYNDYRYFKYQIGKIKEYYSKQENEIMLRQTNRTTDYYISVEFTNPDTKETDEVEVYPSYELFMKTLNEYFSRYYSVKLNGSDNAIWNFFVKLSEYADKDLFEELMEENEFLSLLKEKYMNSYEYDDDENEYYNNLNEDF